MTKTEREVFLAANAWWCELRPLEYGAAEHAGNPTVNTRTPAEKRLAAAVANAQSTARPRKRAKK